MPRHPDKTCSELPAFKLEIRILSAGYLAQSLLWFRNKARCAWGSGYLLNSNSLGVLREDMVDPSEERAGFYCVFNGWMTQVSIASHGKDISFPDRRPARPPPCLGQTNTVTEHVPHGEEGLMLLTDIFQE